MALALAAVLILATQASAGQVPSGRDEGGQAAIAQPGETEPAREDAHENPAPAEADFVASTEFQSGMAAVRLGSPLFFDTHFFGVETNEIGVIGLAWELRHKGLRILPGLGWSFGSENKPAPVATVRWSFESGNWISQGLWALSLRAHLPDAESEHASEEPDAVAHSSILDGVHVSRRMARLELGPMVEHLRYREENEWKGGLRAAWELGRGVKLVAQAVAPDPEVRVGLAWEP